MTTKSAEPAHGSMEELHTALDRFQPMIPGITSGNRYNCSYHF